MIEEQKRRRGRPVAEKPRDITRGIRLDAEEDALIREAAEADGKNVTAWIREKAVTSARRTRRT